MKKEFVFGALLATGCIEDPNVTRDPKESDVQVEDFDDAARQETADAFAPADVETAIAPADAGVIADSSAPAVVCHEAAQGIKECMRNCDSECLQQPVPDPLECLNECSGNCIDEFSLFTDTDPEDLPDCCEEKRECYLDCDSKSCIGVCYKALPTDLETCCIDEELLCAPENWPGTPPTPDELQSCRSAMDVPESCYEE